ncbi:SIS domain-containing protein [Candidatus Jorgensenbacteria bacterium]|nr:SIS domain-containing protein [Candidatus Jorgensenbacteria bacterium]
MYGDYINTYLAEVKEIVDKIDRKAIHQAIEILKNVRDKKGRLFILGVGGGAAHASHAVNDFRKLASIEAYTPVDNVAELTARVNDDGWHTVFARWLQGSSINVNDAVLVFSVGGGNAEKNISMNIVHALDVAKNVGAKVIGVVGRDGGHTRKVADACILVPVVNESTVTPHTESFQAVVWHLIVSHPNFRVQEGKWESVTHSV